MMKKIYIAASVGAGAQLHETAEAPSIIQMELKQYFDHSITKCIDGSLNQLMSSIKELYNVVFDVVSNNDFPVVIGGDHSIALGTWAAIKEAVQKKDIALIWFDAHMDSHTFATSESKAYHGMPLASLLGYYTDGFNLGKWFIKPQNTYIVGVRSYELPERELHEKIGTHIYYCDEVLDRGLEAVLNDILADIESKRIDFGISLDLDYFDPKYIEAVGSPAPNGDNPQYFLKALPKILANRHCIGMEIAEYNPALDYSHNTLNFLNSVLYIIAEFKK